MLRQLRDAVASIPGHETMLVNVRSKIWFGGDFTALPSSNHRLAGTHPAQNDVNAYTCVRLRCNFVFVFLVFVPKALFDELRQSFKSLFSIATIGFQRELRSLRGAQR